MQIRRKLLSRYSFSSVSSAAVSNFYDFPIVNTSFSKNSEKYLENKIQMGKVINDFESQLQSVLQGGP
jgi:hypothetical protein